MSKLSAKVKNLIEKFKSKSSKFKIAVSAVAVLTLAGLIVLGVSLSKPKYDVLFSNMDPKDSGAVIQSLKDNKVNYKVSGNSILVPKDQVDSLRMQLLSSVPMTNGSQGFELMDKSQFGQTDAQMQINYQRALQGELERTIKGFDAVESARVHLVMPQDSAFVKDNKPGSASVTVKLKPGNKLTSEQVKAIMALVSGSVKNIPMANVQVIDDNLTLLSKDVEVDSKKDEAASVEKQQDLKDDYEKKLEKKVTDMLEAVYGKDKVKVKINADLNFDAQQTDTTTYDPKTVIVSQHTVKDSGNGGSTANTASPVDNNMVNNTTTTTNNNGSVNTHDETTTNYDVSKVEDKTIKAPGQVKRLTTSVVLDGNLDAQTKNAVNNLVVSAVGFDTNRGDSISVEGLPFDTTLKDNAKKDLDAMNKAIDQANKMKLYTGIGAGILALALIIGGIVLFLRKKKKETEAEEEEDLIQPKGIDALIDDNTKEEPKQPQFKPIDFEADNEKVHVENEIRKYAKEKPDQVAEVIKSWIAEDER
ncbi:flagellar basal-body MS-ring/collar protein FliF [Clostridium sp. JN-9]|uniref:flagellar basal-body MS-ring/collar protein FliF n=1 Tax=Clostridium sp. JN-9 TaxID=2507159 RepID=UPI000FFE333F|nr:flagellar basal-body MS-ring/collar protein FliF [Clostridium sp. JN-9]QAT39948.1 flagellar basal body M-ring protein FliF [Clostridium sp. JN-9]